MSIQLKRAYDPLGNDGYRVLVDRLWPRGIPKEELQADEWLREVAPTDDLRKDFHKGRLSWGEFRRGYLGELKQQRDRLRPVDERATGETVTLLFSAKDRDRNNAVVMRHYLAMLG